MEQGKTHNSDTSTAESDHNNARSYDCAFCKRGFTNAQALGGHMNIHRKDKDKAKAEKKKNQEADPLIQSFGSGFLPKIAAAGYGHVNCQVYMPPPNPGLQTGNYEYSFYPVWRPDNLPHHLDGTRGLTRVQDEDKDEEEVDLELRLGRLL